METAGARKNLSAAAAGESRLTQPAGSARGSLEAETEQKPTEATATARHAKGLAGRASDEKPGLTPDVQYSSNLYNWKQAASGNLVHIRLRI